MHKKPLLSLLLLLVSGAGFAQNTYPAGYFRSPVDTAIALAGNFGEIRPNHFHAGFDIKTNGKEGMPVYAVADGYISRIKISPYGYGKALYIRHPNGYTSVYGHLKSFGTGIADFSRKTQYFKESYEIDTLMDPELIPVKKGQLIGLSGNTGGSQGPHLHFEIRETATEMPLNPYLFGYKVPDNVPPRITTIVIYPIGEGSVNSRHIPKKIKVTYQKGKHSLLNKLDTVTVNGTIGFGIDTYDTENRSTGQNGVYSIELQSGGKRVYYHEMEKFSFENARYVNAHIDYAEKQKHNEKIQKCFLSKNNLLGIYKDVQNNGLLSFTDDSVHWIRYIVKDYAGNTSELMLKVKSRSKATATKEQETVTILNPALYFDCTKENKFSKEDVQVSIPANALYDDIQQFSYSRPSSVKGSFSPLHRIQNAETALQKAYTLSIRPNHLPDSLQPKACIVSVNEKGGKTYEGGSYKDGWVSTQTKSFGNFTVAVDTVPPRIRTAFKYLPKTTVDLSTAKTIGIIVSDNLSGIKKYRAKIDGNWVLCEYEFKKDLLFYTFDDSVERRVHTFEIEVTDDKGNAAVLMFSFKR
ncbi:MAG: Peptidase [Bacteroidetes bacterium]|nr:Peptidase [Bacteroidota bacterium]